MIDIDAWREGIDGDGPSSLVVFLHGFGGSHGHEVAVEGDFSGLWRGYSKRDGAAGKDFRRYDRLGCEGDGGRQDKK